MAGGSADRTVTTVGRGTARVARDAARVRLTARHAASSLAEALNGAESARAFAVEVCRRHVEAADVATSGLDVWPQHDMRGRPSGFEARHGLVVRCGDLDVAGALVGDLAGSVGDRMVLEGVSLAPSDTTAAEREAREGAYADALARAEHLASLGGVRLGELVAIIEGGATGTGPAVDALAAKVAAAEVDLQPGEADVATTVTATWLVG